MTPGPAPTSRPRISVVVAAYGRSNVLAAALETVRSQTVEDWEVLVVDDASPDDTAGVVEGMGDDRMRVVRLAQNVGEQSGPNNVGAYLASAPSIAFLNQDDLWFPDHLAHLVELHEGTGAQLVYAAQAMARPSADLDPGRSAFVLRAWRPAYDPRFDVPASGWLVDRATHLALGGWRPGRSCFGPSSQDFLFRAWRGGARIQPSGRLSVLSEGSGNRRGSYAERHDDWQRHNLARLTAGPGALRREILAHAKRFDSDAAPAGLPARARWAAQLGRDRALARVGVSPYARRFRRMGLSRGGYLEELRRNRGLPPS